MLDLSFAQLPTTLPRNRRPLVITEPGDYITRAGRRVTVHEIVLYAPAPGAPLRHEVTAFEAKGTLYTPTPTGRILRTYSAWHLTGDHNAVGESPRDIVGRWPAQEHTA